MQKSDLEQLRGVGAVLAQRLTAAGLDSFARIAAAGEEGLRQIKGLNPGAIPSILQQAKELAGAGRGERLAELRTVAATLKGELQGLAGGLKERFKAQLLGKNGRRMEKELLQVLTSLERVEAKLESRVKKGGKSLLKAEKHLAGLADKGFGKVRKGLQKARKTLRKVYA